MVGPCLQLCTRKNTPKCQSFNQISTRDKKLVNHEMCSKLQREGQLCGECSEGHGLPVYSYTLYCVNCTSNNFVRKLFKYIVMAYLPLTGFYAYIIIFRLSGTVGNMVAYILTCPTRWLSWCLRGKWTTTLTSRSSSLWTAPRTSAGAPTQTAVTPSA